MEAPLPCGLYADEPRRRDMCGRHIKLGGLEANVPGLFRSVLGHALTWVYPRLLLPLNAARPRFELSPTPVFRFLDGLAP